MSAAPLRSPRREGRRAPAVRAIPGSAGNTATRAAGSSRDHPRELVAEIEMLGRVAANVVVGEPLTPIGKTAKGVLQRLRLFSRRDLDAKRRVRAEVRIAAGGDERNSHGAILTRLEGRGLL